MPHSRETPRNPEAAGGTKSAGVQVGSRNSTWTPDTAADVARPLAAKGYGLVPVVDKRPILTDWTSPPPAGGPNLDGWAEQGTTGYGLLCDPDPVEVEHYQRFPESHGLVCLDIEAAGMAPLASVVEAMRDKQAGAVVDTPSGGVHVWLKVTDANGSELRKGRLGLDPEGKLAAEVRGRGHQAVIIGPDRIRTPEAARRFAPVSLTLAQYDALLGKVRGRLEPPASTNPRPKRATVAGAEFDGPGRNGTAEILHDAVVAGELAWTDLLDAGWKVDRESGGKVWLKRPDYGAPSTTDSGNALDGSLTIHSTSVPWAEADRSYTPADAHAAARHGRDFHAAMSAIEQAGAALLAGEAVPPLYAAWPEAVLLRVAEARARRVGAAGDASAGPLFVDMSWVGVGDPPQRPQPRWLQRSDGLALFYPAAVNGLYGEPESGKTWIALAAVVEVLRSGGKAAVVDADHNGPQAMAQRLVTLGADAGAVRDPQRFRYATPDDGEHLRAVVKELERWRPDVAVLDSLGELLPMLGCDSERNDQVTSAMRELTAGLVSLGGCVVAIDHVVKNADARGGYAIGAGAKKRAVRGAYIEVRKVGDGMAPGRPGSASLAIQKDTHGALRESHPKSAGVFTLDTGNEEQPWTFAPAEAAPAGVTGDGKPWRPTVYMQRVSIWLELQDGPVSKTALLDGVGGKRPNVATALAALVNEGYVRHEPRQRGSRTDHYYESVRPFREADDKTRPTPGPDPARPGSDTPPDRPSPPPSPVGGVAGSTGGAVDQASDQHPAHGAGSVDDLPEWPKQ